jgi:hypothetical protein
MGSYSFWGVEAYFNFTRFNLLIFPAKAHGRKDNTLVSRTLVCVFVPSSLRLCAFAGKIKSRSYISWIVLDRLWIAMLLYRPFGKSRP